MHSINRREAIHRMALLLGGTMSAPCLAGLAAGCRAPSNPAAYSYAALDSAMQELVGAIADTIIPPTDTPGAIDVGVPAFVDMMLADWYSPDERDECLALLSAFNDLCQERYGHSYADCSEEQRSEALSEAASDAVASRAKGDRRPRVFTMMKQLTMIGYYTSEPGMTVELQYQAVPGVLNGCIPIDEVGRAWA